MFGLLSVTLGVLGGEIVSAFNRFLMVLACDLVGDIDFFPLAAILSFEGSDNVFDLHTAFFGVGSSDKVTSW